MRSFKFRHRWIGVGIAFLASALLFENAAMAQDAGAANYVPMTLGTWQLYPQLLVGGIYDSNVLNSPTQRIGAFGAEIAPQFLASSGNGLHDFRVYGNADVRIYPSEASGNLYAGQMGVANDNSLGPDLDLKWNAEVGQLVNNLKPVASIQSGGASNSIQNESYQQYLLSQSLQKTFGRAWIEEGLDLTVQDSAFANEISATAHARFGIDTGIFSLYAKPSYTFENFGGGFSNVNDYQFVIGVKTDRYRVFSGDIFAGVIAQQFGNSLQVNPAFGGTLTWLPTQALTVTAALSEAPALAGPEQNAAFLLVNQITGSTLPGGAPTVGTPQQIFAPTGSPGLTTTAALTATYQQSSVLSGVGTFAFQHQDAGFGVPATDLWVAQMSATRVITPTLSIGFSYLFSRSLSNIANGDISQNIVALNLILKM